MNNGFLSKIDGQKIGGFSLVVEDRGEGRFSEETNFELYLEDNEGEKSRKPVFWGKYFSGRGKYYSPWIELNFAEKIKFKSNSASFFGGNIGEELFETFFRNLPSGGRIMVVYAGHEETESGLERDIPPPATPIGELLFSSGFVWFKNWYFPEGSREGPVKLQGEKPGDEEARKEALVKIYRELSDFVDREKNRSETLFKKALKRAESVIGKIHKEIPDIESD